MKLIESSVDLLHQDSGVDGLFKFIEYVGRVAYKSEDKITPDSYMRFVNMIYNKGHFAVFDLGTVYLKLNKLTDQDLFNKMISNDNFKKYSRYVAENDSIYITTNYRVICQLGLRDIFQNYWCEPVDQHYRRITFKWICNRAIAQELLRHRVFSPVMESTRYVNYSKDKHNKELTFILPQWIYEVRDELSQYIDPLTGESREYLKELSGVKLWTALTIIDRTVASRDKLYEFVENQYLYETTTEESSRLRPEDARGVLPCDIKTELCMTGWVSDWNYEPNKSSTEKAGFFNLRCAKDAHPDVRVLALKAKELFYAKGCNLLK